MTCPGPPGVRSQRAGRHGGCLSDMVRTGQCVPRAGSGSVNNMGAVVIPGAGTVLREMANKGAWGFFDARNGALISADGETISLPAHVVVDATTLKGDGWTATVGQGWTVQPGPAPGSFRVVRQ